MVGTVIYYRCMDSKNFISLILYRVGASCFLMSQLTSIFDKLPTTNLAINVKPGMLVM